MKNCARVLAARFSRSTVRHGELYGVTAEQNQVHRLDQDKAATGLPERAPPEATATHTQTNSCWPLAAEHEMSARRPLCNKQKSVYLPRLAFQLADRRLLPTDRTHLAAPQRSRDIASTRPTSLKAMVLTLLYHAPPRCSKSSTTTPFLSAGREKSFWFAACNLCTAFSKSSRE